MTTITATSNLSNITNKSNLWLLRWSSILTVRWSPSARQWGQKPHGGCWISCLLDQQAFTVWPRGNQVVYKLFSFYWLIAEMNTVILINSYTSVSAGTIDMWVPNSIHLPWEYQRHETINARVSSVKQSETSWRLFPEQIVEVRAHEDLQTRAVQILPWQLFPPFDCAKWSKQNPGNRSTGAMCLVHQTLWSDLKRSAMLTDETRAMSDDNSQRRQGHSKESGWFQVFRRFTIEQKRPFCLRK